METNLLEIWLRRDPIRWVAGALGGLFAGALAMAVAILIAFSLDWDPLFPIKLLGTPLLGASATEIQTTQGAVAGALLIEAICIFWGIVFAHFTGTNSVRALLGMGLAWGAFSWIFIWNLFLQSFKPIFAARIPAGPAFPVCMTYGLALASVAVFDRMLRKEATTR
jgi:hypothetical protein